MIKSFRPPQRGFTLLEILISLVLICLVVVSVIRLSSVNLRNLSKSDDYIDLLAKANDKMREVLERDRIEETAWRESDDESYAYDIEAAEIERKRSEMLAVKFIQITVKISHAENRVSRTVVLKTAKLISRSGATFGSGAEAAPKRSVD